MSTLHQSHGNAADRTPNLQAAAQAGYGLVVANGVLFTFGPLNTTRRRNPNTKFLGTDINLPEVEGQPKSIRGVQFREQEAGCLVDLARWRSASQE